MTTQFPLCAASCRRQTTSEPSTPGADIYVHNGFGLPVLERVQTGIVYLDVCGSGSGDPRVAKTPCRPLSSCATTIILHTSETSTVYNLLVGKVVVGERWSWVRGDRG